MSKRAALFVLFIMIAVSPAVSWSQETAPATTASASAVPQAPGISPNSGSGYITASGAVQFLFQAQQDDVGTDPVERFLTRRVQLALYGRPADKTRYGIIIDLTDGDRIEGAANGFKGTVREAWIGFDLHPNFLVDVGSFRPPWTLAMDDPVSEEIFVRYPLLVAANPFTPWRQTGFMLTGRGGDFLTINLGIWNGMDNPDNFVDNNNMKDTMVTAKFEFLPGYRIYLGHWGGDTELTTPTGTTSAEYINTWVGTEIERGGFRLGGEALWNRFRPDEGNNLNLFGYQLSMSYTYRDIQPVLRYEFFDPDTSTEADEREWTTIGVNYMIAPTARLMADYIFKSERMDNQTDNDEFLVQLSLWF